MRIANTNASPIELAHVVVSAYHEVPEFGHPLSEAQVLALAQRVASSVREVEMASFRWAWPLGNPSAFELPAGSKLRVRPAMSPEEEEAAFKAMEDRIREAAESR